MKGYIPIEIPTKSYIRAYIISKLGEKPLMNTETNIGCKLYDLLHHTTNEQRTKFSSRYNSKIRIYISYSLFYHRGGVMNETNIKHFNLFLEEEIKSRFRFIMDFYIDVHPGFEHNLPAVRRWLGIDIEAWSDDSMKKDYYRYRKATRTVL